MRSDRLRLLARARGLAPRLRLDAWSAVAVAAGFACACAIVLLAAQPRLLAPRAGGDTWRVGAAAPQDYVVPRDFPYVDEAATELRREAQAALVPPVFTLDPVVSATTLATFDRFTQGFLRHVRQGSTEDAVAASLDAEFPDRLPRADVRLLLSARQPATVFSRARALLQTTLSRGVIDLASHRAEAERAGLVELRSMQDGRLQVEQVPSESALTRDTLARWADARLRESSADGERRIVVMLVDAFGADNAFYDSETTLQHRTRARADVVPVTEKLARGQVLVRRGEIVTEPIDQKIRAVGAWARSVDVSRIAGSILLLAIVFAVALYLLGSRGGVPPLRRGQALLVLGMGVAHVGIAALVIRFLALPDWIPAAVAVPTGACAMLIAILAETPVGVVASLGLSLTLLPLTSMGVQGFLFALLGGIASTAVVLGARKRIDLVRAGLLLALADALVLAVLGLLANYTPAMILGLAGGGLANGFACGVLTLGFLPVLELLLNAPTRFKLMELADLNSPVFKRMFSLAPGTYDHSISVANLAEAACEAIGANALLARVSAYYHDLGKVEQADYFVENQKAYNRHDEMRPRLSAEVIKSHVRIGVQKARELNLPPEIVDVIAQHHGRGLITYFYDRAMKEGRNPRLSRDDYTYPGVRPRSREAAVLMLADSVEAASRTLKRPTEARLERFVRDLIMEKFTSGELGDSVLTLRDLELIRRSFVHYLEARFHTRIEYPKLARGRRGGDGAAGGGAPAVPGQGGRPPE